MSNPRNTDDAVQTAMDRAWEQVNALGGSHNENDPFDRGYDCAIGQVLMILHRLGGRDRLSRAADLRADDLLRDHASRARRAEMRG